MTGRQVLAVDSGTQVLAQWPDSEKITIAVFGLKLVRLKVKSNSKKRKITIAVFGQK